MAKELLIVLYVIEVVKYYLAYEVAFKERLQRYMVPTLGFIINLTAMIVFRSISALLYVLMYLFVLCVIAVVQKVALWDRIQRIILLLFFLSCADEFFDKLLSLFMSQESGSIGWYTLFESLLTLFVILILFLIQKRSDQKENGWFFKNFGKIIMLVVILMALEIVMTITCLNYASKYVEKSGFQTWVIILSLFSYIGIELLGIFILYIRHVNTRMERMVEDEILLQDMQRQYYEALLEREEDTRRYRHDMANHLLCLNKYAEESDLTVIKRYLNDMSQELQKIQKSLCNSGNHILDVITNHYIEMLSPQTEVKISGEIQVQLDEMKLCTIYANLLQNAVEELKHCEDISLLKIQFEQGKHFCRISICNSLSVASRGKTESRLLKSEKNDKRNHGLGISNAKRAVKALNGTLELKKEGDCFLAVVVLPL